MFPVKSKSGRYTLVALMAGIGLYGLYSIASFCLLPAKYVQEFAEIERLQGEVEVEIFGRGWPRSFGPKVRVDLSGTAITDEGLKAIAGIKELEILALEATSISDVGLEVLKNAKGLVYIRLDHTMVSDAGMQILGAMPQLSSLFLKGTRISDYGLKSLRNLVHLRDLDLSETAITDAGLEPLKSIHNLQYLNVSQTQVSDVAIREMRAALPDLIIEHAQETESRL